ncbi:MAG: hypothetical protein ACSHYB_05335 [Roseibacillus sp.]
MNSILSQFETILPLATQWVEEQEKMILLQGEPLSEEGIADARLVGVSHPEKIRVLKVSVVPSPSDPVLSAAATATGLISPNTGGMALRYGIFIRTDCWGERELIAHECVHTSQYERLGSVERFLRQYLTECLTVGYPEAPLEQEAVDKSATIRS